MSDVWGAGEGLDHEESGRREQRRAAKHPGGVLPEVPIETVKEGSLLRQSGWRLELFSGGGRDVTETKEPSKKILIIDDEDDLCVLAAHALTLDRSDLEVISAKDGPSGTQRAKTDQPSVIILDVMMPKMDGYEVCRALKADPKTRDIPVIMLTASSDPHLNQKAFEAGAVACLTKPYRTRTLVNTVDMALASRERARGRSG